MKTKLASGLVLNFLLMANPSKAALSSQTTPSNDLVAITIGLYDYAHTKPAELLQAERTAAAILLKAGVKAVWLACPVANDTSPSTPACAVPGDPTHLTLRLVPGAMSGRLRFVDGDALGFAALGAKLSCDAWIFYDRVKDFALEQRLTFERLLGSVMAHELGHLLLNENRHSDTGLMHGHWSRGELLAIECARLVFSDTEGKGIHSGAIARREAASSVITEVSSFDSRGRLN